MKTIQFILITLCTIVLFSSCTKKEGCTDNNATNYDAEADTDDNSCNFKASVACYFDETEGTELVLSGKSEVNFVMDGTNHGTLFYHEHRDSAPLCNDEKSVAIEISFTGAATKTNTISMMDQHNQLIGTQEVTFNGGDCTPVKVVF